MKRTYKLISKLTTSPGIYKMSCSETDKVYIGETVNLSNRLQKHFSLLRKNKHSNPIWQNVFNKYGEATITVEVLEYLETTDELELKKIEKAWQDKFPNCISLDSNEIFAVERTEEWKEQQRKQLDEIREKAIEVCNIPIIVYDIKMDVLLEFPNVKEATSIIEYKHLNRNINKNQLVPYKARYVGFKKEGFDKDMLKNIVHTSSEIGYARDTCMLYNFLTNEYKLYNSKSQFSLFFSSSENSKLYDAFENKIDHNLYATKIPKTKEEFLDMEIEITPSKMKFYRYFKVSDVYNAFKNGRNNSHIAELLGTSRGTIIKALNIRSQDEWITFFELTFARVKSV